VDKRALRRPWIPSTSSAQGIVSTQETGEMDLFVSGTKEVIYTETLCRCSAPGSVISFKCVIAAKRLE
jgi:hypothetical protein